MSNRAWMPLHIADYLADTGHLTATEHGAYMLLIMHYWQNGHLPANEKLIARVARMTADQWEESRDVIAMLFGPGWTHKRIDAELSKADDIIEKRRAAAEARYGKGKPTADASAVQVDSICTDTGVPPTTDNLSSLRSESEKKREREFDDWFSSWPSQASDDVDASKAESRKLSDDDWSSAVKLTAPYLALAKGGGRTMVVSSEKYLKKRLWERVGKSKPPPTAVVTAISGANYGNPEVYKPPPPETPEQKRKRTEMAAQLKNLAQSMRA
ncbi:YdaU family protein [Pararhizobium sp. DWP1-1-3]|uniref:YdaU family protein n=1 Tax=Pararhizobium sp. DWP1-1-3 TaxID=2804652 RepID=UPI003CF736A8